MEQIDKMSILIGKEAEQGRLLVAISGLGKTATIGAPGSVPASVSRCRLADGVAHSRIDVSGNGQMTITNLKPRNITFVNGFEIVNKVVTNADTIELGIDRYKINLPLVIEVAKKLKASSNAFSAATTNNNASTVDKKTVKYNIAHLERIWNDRQCRFKELADRQKRTNLIRSGCMIFSPCSLLLSFVVGPIGYVCTGIGVLGMAYGFIAQKNDQSQELKERIQDEFEDNYVCPNPDCNKFLGNQSYKLLKKQYSMKCPYCKCDFVEK